jgi:arginine deiminase
MEEEKWEDCEGGGSELTKMSELQEKPLPEKGRGGGSCRTATLWRTQASAFGWLE